MTDKKPENTDTNNTRATSDSDKKKKRTKFGRNKHALKYGIAALSLISFFTTSQGLEEIISSEHSLTPYLISFGIQVIVLVIGMHLANILKTVRKLQMETWKRVFIALFALIPYIVSVCFSSFFSYTFLANQAYSNVRETDYNIKIESFMNEEIANLDSLNDAAGKVVLAQVQNYIPQIDGILQNFQVAASGEIGNIKNSLTLNPTATIPQDVIFSTDAITDASEAQTTRLRVAEAALRTSASTYGIYYSNYKSNYDALMNAENPDSLKDSIETMKTGIESDIQSMREQQRILNEQVQDQTARYNMLLQNSASAVSSHFESLIASDNDLLRAYNLIDTSEAVSSGTIDLQNIYNTIYSTTDVSDGNVEQAILDLQSIITAFLRQANTENVDDTALQNLSACITYLGEFQKYKALSNKLDTFESTVLSQVYVIEYPSTTSNITADAESTDAENTASEDTTAPIAETETSAEQGSTLVASPGEFAVNHVKQEEWIEIRRAQLGEFINMVKSLPNFETITNSATNVSLETRQYIRLLNKNDSYRTDTLKKAYELNRQNLEKISSIEQAWNYLHSDFKYMALYCLFVAAFLDLSSLFVGLFLFFTDETESENISDVPENSSPETVSTI